MPAGMAKGQLNLPRPQGNRMTLDQALAFGLLAATIGLFLWGRLPYDLVALGALLAGVVLGVVPAASAFSGFSDDVVVIVGAALVISHAVARSGAVETLMRPLTPYLRGTAVQVPVLVGVTMLLSMVTKNVGALAILMPVALQLARRTGTPASALLMPMSFASLLGGIVTLVGTSPNIIVARVRQELTGQPFGLFDYTPVGLGIALVGFVFLSLGWRLLPTGRRGTPSLEAAFNIENYTAEARLPAGSPLAGKTVAALEALGDGEARVAVVVRERFRRFVPRPDWVLRPDDVLLLRGEPEGLERLVARAQLVLAGDGQAPGQAGEISVVEGVVTAESPLAGHTPGQLSLQGRHGVTLLAVSRAGHSIQQRLSGLRLRPGDVIVLRGEAAAVPEALAGLRVLPLAERAIAFGHSRRSWLPLLVLAAAMALVATHVLPVAVAFFSAAVVLLLLRVMTMQEAYEAVEWPVLILLAALIPVSEAIQRTGGTDLLATGLQHLVSGLPPLGALTITMVVAMLLTPFLNNAATVLVVGPIAAALAQRLGLNPDPFLMAVAVGAACDFLTPIGHQCNTLVMGPGGYRFGDYARLGLPLSVLVVLTGVPLIAWFWPLGPG